MTHRSNQAVASQDQAEIPPAEPPPPRRFLIGWVTALAALAVSTALVAAGLWLVRKPLAEFMIGAALAERGAEADLQVVDLDFNGLTLRNVRFGAETFPDAAIPAVEARWLWRGLAPQLEYVRLTEPRLRLRLDAGGRVSAGALDRISGGPPGGQRASIPEIELEIVDGSLLIEAPFGAVEGAFRASGRIGRDFAAIGRIPVTSRPGTDYALEGGRADLTLISRDATMSFRITAHAADILWAGSRTQDAYTVVLGRTPLDLGRADAEAAWRIASFSGEGVEAARFDGAVGAQATMRSDSVTIATWQAQGRIGASSLAYDDISVSAARGEIRAEGDEEQANGRWSLGGNRFAGFGLISQQPAASGRFFNTAGQRPTGDAFLTLARTALSAGAQQDLREAFPDLDGTPLGPTFAQAERALDAAANSFTLTAPILFSIEEEGPRLTFSAPIEARAATGARLRLSALRGDTPALVLQWPGPRLHGSVAVELAGGNAPTASLLLDTVTSSAEAPFEADGTLSLSNWRAEGANIAADELGVTISMQPQGRGRIDLRGPAQITGPVGDGQVRDLAVTLDANITWGDGWRVSPNSGCLPVRMGGLDAAGLSFSNGAFALCALNGALLAADRASNLSGGFAIQRLALSGRMSGPAAQPARLGAASVIGRFSGRTNNMTIALTAETPTLAIEMGEDRTLALAMQRITANAQIADSWRVEGSFAQGTLSDPSLPGSVSTIEGAWSATPEDGAPVIRVAAAEALLTANRPASEDERPLFRPLRLVGVDATLRDGVANASGAIVLEERARQLASFAAQHNMDAGEGEARVVAEELIFGPNLQPFEITERARGLVENVSGATSLNAAIVWTRDAITSNGRVGLRGVSLATSTIPIIEDVNGSIYFDDLFALTTSPGQELTVGLLSPGVAVTNGRIRFQLLPEQVVSIEQAEFDFASGVLAMQPTQITLGAEETRFRLTLRDVDATSLLATLNVPDLQATGKLEGSFPLILTRRTALVEGGIVRAQGEGGTISYTGQAGENTTGAARIAFDALRSFRYDSLSLTLDGDLNGDVISSIEFSGQNTGAPIELGAIAPVPGLGDVRVRGVPFDFNVRVTAPFRRLAQTAATITDPGSLLNQAGNAEDEEAVDPEQVTPD